MLESMSCVGLWTLDRVADRSKHRLEFVLDGSFSMHEPDRAEARRFVFYAPEPGLHFRSVSVCAIPIDDLDPCVKRHVISEYLENRPSFHHPSPKCVFRLEAHHQNGIARVTRALGQVM